MANVGAALPLLKEGLTILRTNSAAGFPESNVAKAITRFEVGIGKLEGEEIALKPDISAGEINNIPATLNRGDKGKAPELSVGTKKEVVSIGKYADGWTVEGDRSTFPPKSPGGAKRLSVEPKK